MANVNSTWIGNAVASPKVFTDANQSVGTGRVAKSAATVSATQASGDTIRLVRVPSNARIDAVLLTTADATTAGAINIGVWQTSENGGAVVDADLFASALALTGGPFTRSDQTFESGEYTYAETCLPLWQVLGLTTDPKRDYDIVAQVSTTGDGMGTVMVLEVHYTT
ncbi:MAG: hypothetical protein KG075_09520 [Alphaproteobacteria bacterium]|nr:hypothetical protein [Alphaproteobacteria bacterium]